MKRSRFTEATFYKYKAKFGGQDVSDARKLKALEGENAKLKKLLAKTMPPKSNVRLSSGTRLAVR